MGPDDTVGVSPPKVRRCDGPTGGTGSLPRSEHRLGRANVLAAAGFGQGRLPVPLLERSPLRIRELPVAVGTGNAYPIV